MNAVIASLTRKLRRKHKFASVFTSADGQEVLRDLCVEGFVFRSTFVPNDPHATAMNEGSRRIVMGILREVYRSDDRIQAELARQASEEDAG